MVMIGDLFKIFGYYRRVRTCINVSTRYYMKPDYNYENAHFRGIFFTETSYIESNACLILNVRITYLLPPCKRKKRDSVCTPCTVVDGKG